MLCKKVHLLVRDVFNLWQIYEKVFKLPKNYRIIFKKSDKIVDVSQVELLTKMWYECWAKNLTLLPFLLILWTLHCPIHLLPRDEVFCTTSYSPCCCDVRHVASYVMALSTLGLHYRQWCSRTILDRCCCKPTHFVDCYVKEITGTLKKGIALSFNKIGCTSTIKTNGFVLYCLRFALSLNKIGGTSA